MFMSMLLVSHGVRWMSELLVSIVADDHIIIGTWADAYLYLDRIVSLRTIDCSRDKWWRVWRFPVSGGKSLNWILFLDVNWVLHPFLATFWGCHTQSFHIDWLPLPCLCHAHASLRRAVIVIPCCHRLLIFYANNINQVLIAIRQGQELIIVDLRLGYWVWNLGVEADH